MGKIVEMFSPIEKAKLHLNSRNNAHLIKKHDVLIVMGNHALEKGIVIILN